MLQSNLNDESTDILVAPDGNAALAATEKRAIDAAIVDMYMPGMDGISLLIELKKRFPESQVCIMTARGGIQDAVKAIRSGAADFLEKPLALDMIRVRLKQIRELWKLRVENAKLRDGQRFRFGYESLIGSSQPMRELKSLITKAAPTDASVLILGETGSGKEVVARAIHALSARAGKVFVPIDCASISESLLESEIFGHVKGAFTGAMGPHPGLVRSAEGGTAFFDEIGELPMRAQSKMLRLLQEHEVRPVGSVKSHIVDVRVIAATNRDLSKEVAEKRFREDLFYRLNVLTVRVRPCGRERRTSRSFRSTS